MTDIVMDETGLTVETQEVMTETFRDAMRSDFGDDANVDDPDSPEGRFAAIAGETKRAIAEHFQSAVNDLLPSKSTGVLLKELIKFNGISQNEKNYSTAVLTCVAEPAGCTIPAGKQVQTSSGFVFETDTELVLGGSATGTVGSTCTIEGAILASANTIADILTPVYGWASATNAAAAIPGNLDETPPAMRARRWRAAVGVGLHHVSKIRTMLENAPNVTAVFVEENRGRVVNANGVPPQHVRAIVRGGDPATIGAILFGSYALYAGAGSIGAGIGSWGATSVAVTDSVSGQAETIYFDRPVDKDIYIRVVTTKVSGKYPSNGDALQKQFINEFFAGDLEIEGGIVEAPGLGNTIYGSDIIAACKAVPGHKIQAVYVGFTPNPTSTTVVLTVNQFPVTGDDLITIEGS